MKRIQKMRRGVIDKRDEYRINKIINTPSELDPSVVRRVEKNIQYDARKTYPQNTDWLTRMLKLENNPAALDKVLNDYRRNLLLKQLREEDPTKRLTPDQIDTYVLVFRGMIRRLWNIEKGKIPNKYELMKEILFGQEDTPEGFYHKDISKHKIKQEMLSTSNMRNTYIRVRQMLKDGEQNTYEGKDYLLRLAYHDPRFSAVIAQIYGFAKPVENKRTGGIEMQFKSSSDKLQFAKMVKDWLDSDAITNKAKHDAERLRIDAIREKQIKEGKRGFTALPKKKNKYIYEEKVDDSLYGKSTDHYSGGGDYPQRRKRIKKLVIKRKKPIQKICTCKKKMRK